MSAFYIARQPILDHAGNTFGYELLFRSAEDNAFDPRVDGDSATAKVLINSILEAGLRSLVGDSKAFINCTNKFLEQPDLLELLPSNQCVLEVLETAEVTDELVTGVQALRSRGHLIALDDFTDEERFERLIPIADIIKYDATQHNLEQLIRYRQKDELAGRHSLIERVETHEEFEIFNDAGFNYFQGYYFAKPKVISGSKVASNKFTLMQLMAQINDPSSTIDELAETVSQDVSLGIRVLKFVNSPMTGLATKVTSIRHATILVGRETIRNWLNLLIMTDMDDKPDALIKMALTRARFCQLVAQDKQLPDDSMYFTIGLLSLLDVLMDTDIDSALNSVSIDSEISEVLTKRSGTGGSMLEAIEKLEKPPYSLPDHILIENAGQQFQIATQWTERTLGMI